MGKKVFSTFFFLSKSLPFYFNTNRMYRMSSVTRFFNLLWERATKINKELRDEELHYTIHTRTRCAV